MRDQSESPYRRLRARMFLVLAAFGLVPLLGMAVAGMTAERRALEVRTGNVLEAMTKNRAATVNLFLEEKMRQLDLLAAGLPFDDLATPAVLERLRNEMQRQAGAIVDLGVITADGRQVTYIGPYDLTNRDYHEQPWFEQVMVRGRYQSDIFTGFRRFPHAIIVVRHNTGGRDFLLRATLDTDVLSRLVREGGLESGADVFILNARGEYQTQYPERHRLMEKADLPTPPRHSGVRVARLSVAGRPEFVATAWLAGDAWVLVARQPVPGLGDVVRSGSPVVWASVLGLTLVPLLAYLIARHGLRQIRSLEEERAHLYESVAQSEKLAAIGRLAATTAHEINNPLAIIDAQVGLLRDTLGAGEEPPDWKEFDDRLRKVAGQVERGKSVTHRLLGFSRRLGPQVGPVDVAAALEETVSFVEKEAESARGIRILRDYGPEIPPVRSNLGQMQQVFLNVINNALDAVGHDGDVRLSIGCARGGVEVKISDSGRGIAESDLERIFEPFYSTKEGEARHCGLGLAVCRGSCARSAGASARATTRTAAARPSRCGSRRTTPSGSGSERAAPGGAPDGKRAEVTMGDLRLLLVDDEREFLEPTAARLRRRGVACTTAENVEEAVAALAAATFDCAVVDVRMPRRSGLDLLRHVRDFYPALPLILLTGHASVELGVEGMDLGAFEYLLKPVDLDELLDTVRRAVAQLVP